MITREGQKEVHLYCSVRHFSDMFSSAFRTGNPFSRTKLREIDVGRGLGVLKG